MAEVEHRLVRLTPSAAIWIVGTIVGLVVGSRVFVAAHRPLSWAAAAAVVAVLIDPAVENLARYIRRVPAVLLTFAAAGAVTVGTTYLVFDDVQQALDRLETAAPEAAASVEERDDRLGRIARDGQLVERVESFLDAVRERATGGEDVLRDTAGTAPAYLVGGILTIFLLTYGPRMAAAALAQDTDEERRRRIAAVGVLALRRGRRAVVVTIGTSLVLGLSATALARGLDLPAPAALGFVVGVMSILPHVGLAVGSIPLLLMTLGFRSGTLAIVLAVVVLVVQGLDSLLMRSWIARHTVHIGLLVPWVVALLGYSVYGVGGAAYSTIVAVFVLAAVDQLHIARTLAPVAPATP